jgi:hypothetical protein
MIDNKTEEIITDIFGWHSGWTGDDIRPVKLSSGFPDIKAFAALLAEDPQEEELQTFLESRPQILTGLCGQGDDSTIGFLTKPPVGTKFHADFAILTIGQGGCGIELIEIERSSHPLFTQKGTPSRYLQAALGQVQDWSEWIISNQGTFVRDTLQLLKNSEEYPARSDNGNFRTFSREHIDKGWQAFHGFDDPYISYTIIIGRWSQLSEEHRRRLVTTNRKNQSHTRIWTYEQVARRSYERPLCFP